MARTRVYVDNAARQRAYRKRKKAEKTKPLDAQGLPLDAPVGKITTAERAERAGNDALAQFFGKTKGS